MISGSVDPPESNSGSEFGRGGGLGPPRKDPIFELCDRIRETAYAIHVYLRNGHLEKVNENALLHRLQKQGIRAERQIPLTVKDEDGTVICEFAADVLVEGVLILELKACKHLADEHMAQALGYLRATGLEHALLINFGSPKLQVKKLAYSLDRHSGG